jgi:hypothetical protein
VPLVVLVVKLLPMKNGEVSVLPRGWVRVGNRSVVVIEEPKGEIRLNDELEPGVKNPKLLNPKLI